MRQAPVEFDFAEVMARVQSVVRTVEPHDSVARYTELGVEVLEGTAKVVSPWAVEVSDGRRHADADHRAIVIAAGARPFVPPIPGLEEVGYLTSDTVWNLRELPRRLVVLGGGPIGSELTQAFARLGAQVTQVEMLPRLLMREDPEVSEMVARRFREEGIEVLW
jgi:pyruvate/2-oxoglutarate dehydrogenase complex dihydrolipoamide dehydrogenase (E3) component